MQLVLPRTRASALHPTSRTDLTLLSAAAGYSLLQSNQAPVLAVRQYSPQVNPTHRSHILLWFYPYTPPFHTGEHTPSDADALADCNNVSGLAECFTYPSNMLVARKVGQCLSPHRDQGQHTNTQLRNFHVEPESLIATSHLSCARLVMRCLPPYISISKLQPSPFD